MQDFTSFGLRPSLEALIRANKYTTPTPIQCDAIPEVLAGHDVVGLAQTGTGKTAAFVLPIVERLMQNPGHGVRALALVPTRELAEQVLKVVRVFTAGSGIRSCAVYGGASMSLQIRDINNGASIVIACPGRLLDHMRRGSITLERVDTLILDEADQMFERGFLPDVRSIIRHIPKDRQTLLFSATMPPEVEKLTNEILRSPKVIRSGGESAPAVTVEHRLVAVDLDLKTELLMEVLKGGGVGSVLVFTRTKHRAERLGSQLSKMGVHTASLQGDLSQNRRTRAINGFRSGKFQVLVATDIAARGIDVANVTHVVNYDIPENAEAYTHRIGRTGRANNKGEAITFVTKDDIRNLRFIERSLGKPIVHKQYAGFEASFQLMERARGGESAGTPRRGSGGGQKRSGGGAGAGNNQRPGPNHRRGRSEGQAQGQSKQGQSQGRSNQWSGGRRAANNARSRPAGGGSDHRAAR